MEPNGTLRGDDELILALAAGTSVREVAEQAGMGERTAYRRLAAADFRRAVREARGRLFDGALGQLAGLTGKATETLERLMQSDKPSEALAAAKVVLQLVPRLRKATELEERLNRLEDEADENASGNEVPAGEDELIPALAAGVSVREADEQAGVEQETARSRLADPDFRRAVSRARGLLFDAASGRLAGLASRAPVIFERLMESDQPSVARRAAKAVLELGPRLRESELQERISRLEDQADEKANGNLTADNIANEWYEDFGAKQPKSNS